MAEENKIGFFWLLGFFVDPGESNRNGFSFAPRTSATSPIQKGFLDEIAGRNLTAGFPSAILFCERTTLHSLTPFRPASPSSRLVEAGRHIFSFKNPYNPELAYNKIAS